MRARALQDAASRAWSSPARLRIALTAPSALALILIALAALALAAPAQAAARPTVVVSYYESERLPNLVDALNRSGMPADTPVYFGNYLAQPRAARVAALETGAPNEIAGQRYRWAPILAVRESTDWDRRRVSDADAQKLAAAGQGDYSGSMPSYSEILKRPSGERVRWGTELGRRFRDRIRSRLEAGEIRSWQFDELVSEVAAEDGRPHRDFARGILRGVHEGRKPLGDAPVRGLVWVAHPALALASQSLTTELARFWRQVNVSSQRLVGEEYPFFRGDASEEAYRQAAGQRDLRRGGGDRAALARRYMVGMTPGYIVTQSLGGNVDGRSREWVNAWRAEFVRARAEMGVAGFGEFNFMPPNNTDEVMRDVTRAIARGAELLGG